MADRSIGTALIALGAALGVIAVGWLVANAASGILGPGGFVLGLFFLVLFIFPLVAAGFYVRRRAALQEAAAVSFEGRRRLLERDRIFRRTLEREARRTARLLEAGAAEAPEEVAELLRRGRESLEGLAEEASQPVGEADWLHAAALEARDERSIEGYDDLLLAGIRRIREEVERLPGMQRPEAARELLELANSARRQFTLRQDLLLRGRRLPPVSPLHLLRPEIPERRQVAPESLHPGGAVSRAAHDYLVTARIAYFAEGRSWCALVLRGEEGERRLQVEPGASRALFMEPVDPGRLGGRVAERGSASISIDSLSGTADGIVVDYRLVESEGGQVGWWERWPEGERAYTGERVELREFEFWPAAVGSG